MRRRRKRSPFKKFKAWPLLLLLAGIYWAKELFGISDISDVNALSDAALPIALVLLGLAATVLVLRLMFRPKKQEQKREFSKKF